MTRMALRRLAWRAGIGAALFACGAALAAPATLHAIYPRIKERSAGDYGYRVLRRALDKAGLPYRLEQSAYPMNPAARPPDARTGRHLDL